MTTRSAQTVSLGRVERVASAQRRRILGAQRAQQVERVPAADRPAGRTQRRRVVHVSAPSSVTGGKLVMHSALQTFSTAVGAARF